MKNEELLNESTEQNAGKAAEQSGAVADPAEDTAQQETQTQTQTPNEEPVGPSKDETIASLKTRLIQSETRSIAKEYGVTEKKLPYVVELVKVANIDPDNEDAAQMIRAAVEKVLDDIPELKMQPIVGTGSAGNFPRRSLEPQASTQQQVAAAMARGRR